jgi:FMN-dependent NADH-azoreductase
MANEIQTDKVDAMTNSNIKKVLRIDSSAANDSITRRLGDEVVRRLQQQYAVSDIIVRDLNQGVDFIDRTWVEANLTQPSERSRGQKSVLGSSDQLIEELASADVVVITAPIYNFSLPAVLKAYIDMICRAGLSFSYTEKGPVGLLKDRPVYMVMASGGVPFGSPADFASAYLKHILGFVGIRDVRAIFAEATNSNISVSEDKALKMLAQWLPLETTEAA